MFFNSHRKDAKKIANECLYLLKLCFSGLNIDNSKEIEVPQGFYDDPYIFGYFQGFV